MPPDMAVSMRHTKLKAEEAALLAGEISKPIWESRNEGIHERVSFEDSIWGFDLAGGAYYKTPLRVTYVKPDSRAEKAGIRAGDKLLTINGMDTSTLTIQQAHDLVIESGIHLKLSVSSPDDEEDAYYCYQDPVEDGYDSEEERRLEEERARKRQVHAKVSSYWSLQWPWVSKRRLIYRESNCFMVDSKYEETRRDKYPPLPVLRYTDDILMYQKDGDKENNVKKQTPSLKEVKENARKSRQQRTTNGDASTDATVTDDDQLSHVSEDERSVNGGSSISPIIEDIDEELEEENDIEIPTNEESEEAIEDAAVNDINEFENKEESNIEVLNTHESEEIAEDDVDVVDDASILNNVQDTTRDDQIYETIEENEEQQEVGVVNTTEDDVINEVLAKNSNDTRSDEDNILDSILSDDGQNLESSEANNER